MSSAASAVSSTVSRAVQGSGIKGIEAPLPKSVQRANAAKVRYRLHAQRLPVLPMLPVSAALWGETQWQASAWVTGNKSQAPALQCDQRCSYWRQVSGV